MSCGDAVTEATTTNFTTSNVVAIREIAQAAKIAADPKPVERTGRVRLLAATFWEVVEAVLNTIAFPDLILCRKIKRNSTKRNSYPTRN